MPNHNRSYSFISTGKILSYGVGYILCIKEKLWYLSWTKRYAMENALKSFRNNTPPVHNWRSNIGRIQQNQRRNHDDILCRLSHRLPSELQQSTIAESRILCQATLQRKSSYHSNKGEPCRNATYSTIICKRRMRSTGESSNCLINKLTIGMQGIIRQQPCRTSWRKTQTCHRLQAVKPVSTRCQVSNTKQEGSATASGRSNNILEILT